MWTKIRRLSNGSPLFAHKRYIRLVQHKAGRYGGLKSDHRHYRVWLKLKATNLDLVYPLVSWLYAAKWGRPARCLICMLRSCLAMMLCGQTSFDDWVQLMRDDPFYALISGFDPDNVPGVGTFYDFQDRLLPAIPNLKSLGRSRGNIQLQLFNHKVEKMVPIIKTQIAGQGTNIIEKSLSGP